MAGNFVAEGKKAEQGLASLSLDSMLSMFENMGSSVGQANVGSDVSGTQAGGAPTVEADEPESDSSDEAPMAQSLMARFKKVPVAGNAPGASRTAAQAAPKVASPAKQATTRAAVGSSAGQAAELPGQQVTKPAAGNNPGNQSQPDIAVFNLAEDGRVRRLVEHADKELSKLPEAAKEACAMEALQDSGHLLGRGAAYQSALTTDAQ